MALKQTPTPAPDQAQADALAAERAKVNGLIRQGFGASPTPDAGNAEEADAGDFNAAIRAALRGGNNGAE